MLHDLALPLAFLAVAIVGIGIAVLVSWLRRRRMYARSVRSLHPVSGQWLADHRRSGEHATKPYSR
jgi:hypothetical protein